MISLMRRNSTSTAGDAPRMKTLTQMPPSLVTGQKRGSTLAVLWRYDAPFRTRLVMLSKTTLRASNPPISHLYVWIALDKI